ncbi:hypothetical protein DL95DRAFT_461835 [Leptodontidium sp. 2 PMI_412]|nr:hypothetical protein DL95DRAFT_461835 [Leptodontidium sp. 2 PMI_412]
MHLRSNFLSGLGVFSTLILANPLKIDISLETGDELIVPNSSDRASVATDSPADPSAVLNWEPGFDDERQVYDRSDSSCQKIEGKLRTAFQSATITGYCACLFYTDSDSCEEQYISVSLRSGYFGHIPDAEGLTSFQCLTSCEESQSTEVFDAARTPASTELKISEDGVSHVAMSPPGYNDTAKILFWNDLDFTGKKKRYQVIDEKCYNLPKDLVNYVVSAELEPKIWYCTFYPEEACEAKEGSDEVHHLPAGEYDFLFPEGMDFVSFKCRLYEKRPKSLPDSPVSISTTDKSTRRRPSSFQTVMSLPESETRNNIFPFAVQLFAYPGFQGSSSTQKFLSEEPSCVSLSQPPGTDFTSVLFGQEIESCFFYPTDVEVGCTGQAVLQRSHSETRIQTGALGLKSMKCLLKSRRSEVEGLQSDTSTEPQIKAVVPSVQLYGMSNFRGPVSNIPYYPGTWGCVPLKSPHEFGFHSIRMSPEFRSCSFFYKDACHGEVMLRIQGTTYYVPGTELMSLRTMYCSFES